MNSLFRRCIVVAALAACPLAAMAANLSVFPLRTELSQAKSTEVFTIRNQGNEPVVVQASVVKWSQKDGREVLEPTREVLVAPAVIEVPGNESQIVRLAVRRPPDAAKEDSFRLLIQEVPKRKDVKDAQLTFTLNISIPIFYTPVSGTPAGNLDVEAARPTGAPKKQLSLDLNNAGTGHVQVTSIKATDDQGQLGMMGSMFYLLPNQKRSIVLNVERLPGTGKQLKVEFETTRGRVTKDLTVQ